ncbi:IS1595 family transposase [Burkholderia gladioli]|uniref:IS1595 family transposase n=1 Tax=Burkholderia gladioli TaxID=28095 RepID=UPI00163F7D9E|nr:IS1595 family transposase [Burkholderia gladioli]
MKTQHQQHFLLSAKARSLSLKNLYTMTDDEAFIMFRELRWGTGDEVICPSCGTVAKHYFIKTRRQWRCRACSHTFSVTSGTIFAFHKLPLRDYLVAIAIFTNAVKGISALQLARDLDVQYKTAFVLAHKIRESLMEHRDIAPLAGEIHLDGAYVNGHVRPKNRKEDRIDRRLAKHQKPTKRCVFVMRQKCGELAEAKIPGANRTLTFVLKNENQKDISHLANIYVLSGSIICADEANAYDPLHARFDTRRVNHQQEYQAVDGTTNNLAESYFSRFRRMQYGQVHKFGNLYLANYANEAAYREDTRRWSNGDIFRDIAKKCARTKTHRDWCGYWQGNKRKDERLAA